MPPGKARRPKASPGPKFATPDQVAEMVRRIGAWSAARGRDRHVAFEMEYQLYRAVIASIAAGAPMAREMCEAAIRSQQWGFERWADE